MSKSFVIASLGGLGLMVSLTGCQLSSIVVSSPVSLDIITATDTETIVSLADDTAIANIPGLAAWLQSCAATMQPFIYPFPGYSYGMVELLGVQDLQVSRLVMDAPQPVVSPHVEITLNGIVADGINEDSGVDIYRFIIPKANVASLNCAMEQSYGDQRYGGRSATLTTYSIERRVPDPIYSAWLPTIRQHPKMNRSGNYESRSVQWDWTNTDTTISVVALFIDSDTTDEVTRAEVQFTVNRTSGEVMDLSVEELPPPKDPGYF